MQDAGHSIIIRGIERLLMGSSCLQSRRALGTGAAPFTVSAFSFCQLTQCMNVHFPTLSGGVSACNYKSKVRKKIVETFYCHSSLIIQEFAVLRGGIRKVSAKWSRAFIKDYDTTIRTLSLKARVYLTL